MNSSLIAKYIDLGNYRLSYWQGGVASMSATPLLFIHGWGISTKPYLNALDLLAQRHWVIAPDLPGFARSTSYQPLEDYQSYADCLFDFMAALAIEKAHLVGHSLGGGIAIMMAALAPEKVQSLLVVNSTGFPGPSLLELLLHRAIELPAQFSIHQLKLQVVDIPQAFIHNLVYNTQTIFQTLKLVLEKDLRTLLSLVQSPCLVLWSENDLTTPLSTAQEIAQRIRGATLITIAEKYHEWSLLYPEKFTSIVSNFINQIEIAIL